MRQVQQLASELVPIHKCANCRMFDSTLTLRVMTTITLTADGAHKILNMDNQIRLSWRTCRRIRTIKHDRSGVCQWNRIFHQNGSTKQLEIHINLSLAIIVCHTDVN